MKEFHTFTNEKRLSLLLKKGNIPTKRHQIKYLIMQVKYLF